MYLQSSYDINDVRFTADREASTVNPNLEVAGFKLLRSDTTALDYRYESSLGNPDAVSDTGHLYIAEHLTQIEINRTGFSLYLMCFIAMRRHPRSGRRSRLRPIPMPFIPYRMIPDGVLP